MNPYTIIARNCTWSTEYDETSFVAMLHERQVWQKDEYWLLEWALYELIKQKMNCENLYGPVFKIFSHMMCSLSSHLDKNDLFEITNLDGDEIYGFRERIQIVFEAFFCKKNPDQAAFSEENPLIVGDVDGK